MVVTFIITYLHNQDFIIVKKKKRKSNNRSSTTLAENLIPWAGFAKNIWPRDLTQLKTLLKGLSLDVTSMTKDWS